MKNHVNNLKFFAKSIPTPDPPLFLKLLVDQLCQCLCPHVPVELPTAFHANTPPEGGCNPVHDQHLPPLEVAQPTDLPAALLTLNDHYLFWHVTLFLRTCFAVDTPVHRWHQQTRPRPLFQTSPTAP